MQMSFSSKPRFIRPMKNPFLKSGMMQVPMGKDVTAKTIGWALDYCKSGKLYAH